MSLKWIQFVKGWKYAWAVWSISISWPSFLGFWIAIAVMDLCYEIMKFVVLYIIAL
jgi:hypothetical protein